MPAKMTKQALFSLLHGLLCLCSVTLGQPAQAPALPAANAPAQPAVAPVQPVHTPTRPGHPDLIKILQSAGGFTILTRLLKISGVADQLKGELDHSKSGFTIFAPPDSAFSSLQSGTLNTLGDQEKVRLLQFHTLPNLYSLTNFQTVSNPVRTQAGDTDPGEYPLNVTNTGNLVNISTGVVNATVTGTLYSDKKLAVYQVDHVLLPQDIFAPKPPAPAPATAPALSLAPAPLASKPKPKKKKKAAAEAPALPTSTPTVVDSGAGSSTKHGILVSLGVSVFVSAFSL